MNPFNPAFTYLPETSARSTSSQRVAFIQSHYLLRQTLDGWEALSMSLDGDRVDSEITGLDRADVCRRARAQWGHFNFQDEADTFSAIFS